MEFPILVRWLLYIESGPRIFQPITCPFQTNTALGFACHCACKYPSTKLSQAISTGTPWSFIKAHFLSLAPSKLRLCSANHRAGYFSNLACDWLSIVWAHSKQETENRPRSYGYQQFLNSWSQVMHICVSKLTNIGLDNGLLPGRHQAIISVILLIGPLVQTSVKS